MPTSSAAQGGRAVQAYNATTISVFGERDPVGGVLIDRTVYDRRAHAASHTTPDNTTRTSVDSTDDARGYGERKATRTSVDSIEPGLYGAAIATPRSGGSVSSEPGADSSSSSCLLRLEYFYHRYIQTYPAAERERAMYGNRYLKSNLAEYDALRHQVPNVTMLLKPIASPDALGLAASFTGSWLLSTVLMGWVSLSTGLGLAPLLLVYGGIAQIQAAFRAIRYH